MAGNSRIQGITVEIGGDTGPLSKALQGINREIQGTQSQLKDVERLLKMDPGNTELLQQKQRLLGDAIGETKTKLDALKTAEQQAQAQFQKGEISQKQYDGLKREIADTEIKLKGLEKSYSELGNAASRALQSASESIKGFGEKTSALGQKFLPVTAGIAGIGTAAVAAMNSVDDGLDVITQKTGATGETAKQMQEIFNQVASKIPADFEDIGAAIGEINTRLGFTGDQLAASSEDFLKFAKVNGTDVNTSVQLVTRAMGDAGIKSTEYKSLLDDLTVAGQQSGISIDALTQNLAKYGAPMRALGIDTKQAIALFAGWEKAGVNTEIAFSGMKKAISNWGAAGKDSTAEFQKTLDAIKKAPDIATATSMAIEVFGAKAGPDLADAIQGGRFEVDAFTKALESSKGTVDSTYGMLVDEVDDTQLAMQNMKLALHDLGEVIAKTVGPIVLELANKFKGIMDHFNGLDSGTKKLIVTIAGIVAAIGPALIVIGKLSTGFGTVVGIVGKVVGLFSGGGGLVAALGAITGPVGIVVAAVGALVAIFATLFATNEDFRNKVGEIWGQIQQIFSSVLEQIRGIIQGFIDVANAIWENFGSEIMAVVSAAFDFIKTYIDSAMKVVKDVIDVVMGLINGDWERVWNGLKNLVSDVLNGIMAIISSWQQLVQKAFELLGSVLGNAWTAIKGVALQAWEGIKTSIVNIVDNIKTGVLNGFNNLKSGVATTVGNVTAAIKNGLGKAVDYVKGLPSKFLGWGKDMIQGLINGIKSKIGAVADAVSSVADRVKNFLHFSRPDEGPLRDYETWMPDFMSGLAAGIRQNASRVTRALGGLTDNMVIDMQPVTAAAAGTAGGTQTITQPVSILVEIGRMDNGSGQAPRAIAEQINTELQRIQQRSKAQW